MGVNPSYFRNIAALRLGLIPPLRRAARSRFATRELNEVGADSPAMGNEESWQRRMGLAATVSPSSLAGAVEREVQGGVQREEKPVGLTRAAAAGAAGGSSAGAEGIAKAKAAVAAPEVAGNASPHDSAGEPVDQRPSGNARQIVSLPQDEPEAPAIAVVQRAEAVPDVVLDASPRNSVNEPVNHRPSGDARQIVSIPQDEPDAPAIPVVQKAKAVPNVVLDASPRNSVNEPANHRPSGGDAGQMASMPQDEPETPAIAVVQKAEAVPDVVLDALPRDSVNEPENHRPSGNAGQIVSKPQGEPDVPAIAVVQKAEAVPGVILEGPRRNSVNEPEDHRLSGNARQIVPIPHDQPEVPAIAVVQRAEAVPDVVLDAPPRDSVNEPDAPAIAVVQRTEVAPEALREAPPRVSRHEPGRESRNETLTKAATRIVDEPTPDVVLNGSPQTEARSALPIPLKPVIEDAGAAPFIPERSGSRPIQRNADATPTVFLDASRQDPVNEEAIGGSVDVKRNTPEHFASSSSEVPLNASPEGSVNEPETSGPVDLTRRIPVSSVLPSVGAAGNTTRASHPTAAAKVDAPYFHGLVNEPATGTTSEFTQSHPEDSVEGIATDAQGSITADANLVQRKAEATPKVAFNSHPQDTANEPEIRGTVDLARRRSGRFTLSRAEETKLGDRITLDSRPGSQDPEAALNPSHQLAVNEPANGDATDLTRRNSERLALQPANESRPVPEAKVEATPDIVLNAPSQAIADQADFDSPVHLTRRTPERSALPSANESRPVPEKRAEAAPDIVLNAPSQAIADQPDYGGPVHLTRRTPERSALSAANESRPAPEKRAEAAPDIVLNAPSQATADQPDFGSPVHLTRRTPERSALSAANESRPVPEAKVEATPDIVLNAASQATADQPDFGSPVHLTRRTPERSALSAANESRPVPEKRAEAAPDIVWNAPSQATADQPGFGSPIHLTRRTPERSLLSAANKSRPVQETKVEAAAEGVLDVSSQEIVKQPEISRPAEFTRRTPERSALPSPNASPRPAPETRPEASPEAALRLSPEGIVDESMAGKFTRSSPREAIESLDMPAKATGAAAARQKARATAPGLVPELPPQIPAPSLPPAQSYRNATEPQVIQMAKAKSKALQPGSAVQLKSADPEIVPDKSSAPPVGRLPLPEESLPLPAPADVALLASPKSAAIRDPEPAPRPGPRRDANDGAPSPHYRVTIGRVDFDSASPEPRQRRGRTVRPSPSLTLDAYLKSIRGGRS